MDYEGMVANVQEDTKFDGQIFSLAEVPGCIFPCGKPCITYGIYHIADSTPVIIRGKS